jgi:hypothetical protein
VTKVPRYKVHRIKESQKEHFRWSAHTGGLAIVKPRDYEPGGEVESLTPYSLWKELQDSGSSHHERPLSPGDVLETIDPDGLGRLFITKYIGFEPAQWFVPEVKADPPTDDSAVSQPENALHS